MKIIILALFLLFWGLYNVYSLVLNKTNHTGTDFMFFAKVIVGIAIVLLLGTILKPNLFGKNDTITKIIFILSLLIMTNITYFSKFNIMLEYNEWQKRGMPNKPF